MGIIIEVTVGGSDSYNNATSVRNTGGGYFLYFGTIGANPFGRFGVFRENNNNPPSENNNNNNLLSFPLLGFRGGLEGGFNLLPEGNVGRLDPNIVALVNALTGANLEI